MFYLDDKYSQGVRDTIIDNRWREHDALRKDFVAIAHNLYKFPDDYELSVLTTESKITDCSEGRVIVYYHYFEFGLPFPLDLMLVKIFKCWKICLAQLHSLAR